MMILSLITIMNMMKKLVVRRYLKQVGNTTNNNTIQTKSNSKLIILSIHSMVMNKLILYLKMLLQSPVEILVMDGMWQKLGIEPWSVLKMV